MGAGSLGMNNSFGDSLSVEVGKFVNEVEIRNNDGSIFAGGDGVLVVVDRLASRCSENLRQ